MLCSKRVSFFFLVSAFDFCFIFFNLYPHVFYFSRVELYKSFLTYQNIINEIFACLACPYLLKNGVLCFPFKNILIHYNKVENNFSFFLFHVLRQINEKTVYVFSLVFAFLIFSNTNIFFPLI